MSSSGGSDDDSEDSGPQTDWKIQVHVKDKTIMVHAGAGAQPLKWLADVGIALWDEKDRKGFLTLGAPVKILSDKKEELDMSSIINETLKNKSHIFVETSDG